MLHCHLVFVSVPVSPAGSHLATQFAGAGAIVIDQIIQCQVVQSILLVSNNQGPLNILKQEFYKWKRLGFYLSQDSCPGSPP